MPVRFAAALAACLGLVSCTTAWSAQKRLDRTFTVAPGGRLTVEIAGGDITVSGSDSDQVVVHLVVPGAQRSTDRMDVSAEQTPEGVVVRAGPRREGWLDWLWTSFSSNAQLIASVPRRYNLDLDTSGGDLSVSGVQGDVQGKTSGGDIRVSDVTGPVRMHTSGGDVKLEEVRGSAYLRTTGGSIVARDIGGDTDVETSGGSIRLETVRGSTRAHTSSGDVIAMDVQGDTDLQTSGGDIDARAIDGRIRAHTSGGDVSVELLGANRGISATSSGGDIILRVPKDIAAELNASTSGGSVRSELPVSTTQAEKSKLRGTINGGGPQIVARTSGGSIRLLPAKP